MGDIGTRRFEDRATPPSAADTGLPPEVVANNEAIAKMDADVRQLMDQQRAVNNAGTEEMLYVNMAFNEAGKVAQRSIDHFIKFAETREHRELNALAAQQKVDLPHPGADAEFGAYSSNEARGYERDRHTTELIGELMDHKTPPGMDQTRDKITNQEHLLGANAAPRDGSEDEDPQAVRELLDKIPT